jgi:hypothetical protein
LPSRFQINHNVAAMPIKCTRKVSPHPIESQEQIELAGQFKISLITVQIKIASGQ